MSNILYVIDGMPLCYGLIFAFINNPQRNDKGQNTSAIFGIQQNAACPDYEQNPDHHVVAF
jgi:hypothetical protein